MQYAWILTPFVRLYNYGKILIKGKPPTIVKFEIGQELEEPRQATFVWLNLHFLDKRWTEDHAFTVRDVRQTRTRITKNGYQSDQEISITRLVDGVLQIYTRYPTDQDEAFTSQWSTNLNDPPIWIHGADWVGIPYL